METLFSLLEFWALLCLIFDFWYLKNGPIIPDLEFPHPWYVSSALLMLYSSEAWISQ